MTDGSTVLTLAARAPEPYVHLDNRGATRMQGDHVLGGFAADDGVVLYAGSREDVVSVGLALAGFEQLRETMGA